MFDWGMHGGRRFPIGISWGSDIHTSQRRRWRSGPAGKEMPEERAGCLIPVYRTTGYCSGTEGGGSLAQRHSSSIGTHIPSDTTEMSA